jgi:hypothetical protein
LKAVRERYYYWTERLTDGSFQLSLAVLAANWAVYGDVAKIMDSIWAKGSVCLVIMSVAVNLLGAKRMGEMHRLRIEYASEDVARWESDCASALGRNDPWPFTQDIDKLGRCLRRYKTWLPLAAGASFLVALATS